MDILLKLWLISTVMDMILVLKIERVMIMLCSLKIWYGYLSYPHNTLTIVNPIKKGKLLICFLMYMGIRRGIGKGSNAQEIASLEEQSVA